MLEYDRLATDSHPRVRRCPWVRYGSGKKKKFCIRSPVGRVTSAVLSLVIYGHKLCVGVFMSSAIDTCSTGNMTTRYS